MPTETHWDYEPSGADAFHRMSAQSKQRGACTSVLLLTSSRGSSSRSRVCISCPGPRGYALDRSPHALLHGKVVGLRHPDRLEWRSACSIWAGRKHRPRTQSRRLSRPAPVDGRARARPKPRVSMYSADPTHPYRKEGLYRENRCRGRHKRNAALRPTCIADWLPGKDRRERAPASCWWADPTELRGQRG
jgi:hypothetical protein